MLSKTERTVMYNDVDDDDIEFANASEEEKEDNAESGMESSHFLVSSSQRGQSLLVKTQLTKKKTQLAGIDEETNDDEEASFWKKNQ